MERSIEKSIATINNNKIALNGNTKNDSKDCVAIRLRAATYLAPSLPIDYFETIMQYLKTKLGYLDTSLLYETQWEDSIHAFQAKQIDLAWMTSTAYLKLSESNMKSISLLPVSSVDLHSKSEDRPGVFIDVIMHKNLSGRVKEFIDLRGCRWAYNSPNSLSGYGITLYQLKQFGENSIFFGECMQSSSHLESIHMVLNKKVDAAAIESNCLKIFLDRNPKYRDDIVSLTSWGPIPPHPLVVSADMPEFLQKEIMNTLLHMHEDSIAKEKLEKYGIKCFAPISETELWAEKDFTEQINEMDFEVRYY